MCKAFTYREKCYTCEWESHELETSEKRPGHELCSNAKNRRNYKRYGYMACRYYPKKDESLQEERVTVYEPHNGTQCWGRCAEKEEEEIEIYKAERTRQLRLQRQEVMLEVQKEDAERRRQIQQQYINDCVETIQNAPKQAERANEEQEERLKKARQHLARIELWHEKSAQGTIWREDMYQTMGAQESLS